MPELLKHLRGGKSPFVILISICVLATVHSTGWSQDKPGQEVTVTAVEIPVRVLQNGQFLKDLTREDFELYANGIRQNIVAFEARVKRISAGGENPQGEAGLRRAEGRIFFLIFNIFDYSDSVGEAIDFFFRDIFRKGDRLVILTEGNLLDIDTGKGVSQVADDLKYTLKRFKVISSMRILNAYGDLSNEADRLLSALRGRSQTVAMAPDRAILNFYENYQRIWLEYKKQFVTPDHVLYASLLKRIKRLDGEKWAIGFQQREMFPELKNESSLEREIREWIETQNAGGDPVAKAIARNVRAKQMSVQRLFDVSTDMPVEVLKDLFLEAGVTLHFVLLKSSRTLVTRNFGLREVGGDYENCFREISRATGGRTFFSNKVAEALAEASTAEDATYLLVYTPGNEVSGRPQKIEIRVSRPGVDVVHLKQFVNDPVPPVTIKNFSSQGKTISFTIADYQRTRTQAGLSGVVEVKIVIFDEQSNAVYDEAKILSTVKDETHVSIPFNQLESGYYFVIVQVADRISNTLDVLSRSLKF